MSAGALASAVLLPLTAILAVPAYRTFQAFKSRDESEKSLKENTELAAGDLHGKIDSLRSAGLITKDQANKFSRQLKGGDVAGVQIALNRAQGGRSMDSINDAPEAKRLDEEHHKKMLDFNREELTANSLLTSDLIQRHIILEQMAGLDKNSVDYKKKQLELDEADHAVLKDKADAQKDLNGHAHDLQTKIFDNNDKLSTASAEYPTIENLAGRGFTSQLNANYGAGGKWELGKGDGPMSDVAQDYLTSMKQQVWDRTYGNKDQADKDRKRAMGDLSTLSQNGMASPAQNMTLVAANTLSMAQDLQKMVHNGAVITARLVDDTAK